MYVPTFGQNNNEEHRQTLATQCDATICLKVSINSCQFGVDDVDVDVVSVWEVLKWEMASKTSLMDIHTNWLR